MRHRSDKNQAEIVAALRSVGCAVYIMARPLDLLIWSPFQQRHIIADVKNPDGKGSTLTADQKKFVSEWAGPWYLIRSVDEALEVVGAKA